MVLRGLGPSWSHLELSGGMVNVFIHNVTVLGPGLLCKHGGKEATTNTYFLAKVYRVGETNCLLRYNLVNA
jgi:hypothetical protein